ncbi:POLR2G [Cordylochernes scorpioides]|uniref:DNA-directed RNA polymerase II subunit RPB7 n=1 Tax=Cordylochernes scorpioides TaxID=51811 RepID=A0ABY6KXD2_9ARAC|nr:POLR2G [Cordylochernes scorpioides]
MLCAATPIWSTNAANPVSLEPLQVERALVVVLQISLEHEILLHPRYFGPNLMETVKHKLFTEVEGTCSGKYGFVIAVTSIDNIGAGFIQPGRGFVLYPIKYKAIVFRPFKGEVLDAVVTQINKLGIFTEVGPLSCFISRHCIPSDMVFDPNSNPPCYRTQEEVSPIPPPSCNSDNLFTYTVPSLDEKGGGGAVTSSLKNLGSAGPADSTLLGLLIQGYRMSSFCTPC